MTKKATLLTFFMLVFSLTCSANDPLPESKKIWLANMQKNLPALLCQKEHYFVQCFETNEKECLALTTLLVQTCLNNVSQNLADELTSSQVEYWGQIVGRCSYDVYQKMLKNKKRNTPACNDNAHHKDDLPTPSQVIP